MDSTESTPLLAHSRPELPCVAPVVHRLQALEVENLNKNQILALCPNSLRLTPAEETAFALVVLLQLRLEEATERPSNSWDKWSLERRTKSNSDRLESQALGIWSQFIDNWCTDDALTEVLSTRFYFDETHQRSITLIELLCNATTPKRLLAHRLMDLTIYQLWTAGHRQFIPSESSLVIRMASFVKRFSTPRVMHALDLIMHAIYVVTLLHFAMYPPAVYTLSLSAVGCREQFLIIYTFASFLNPPFILFTPNLFVFLSFVAALPASPIPGDFSYTVLQFAIISHLIGLHSPNAPGPAFSFWPKHTLPLSLFLWDGFKRVFCPVLLFFIPILLVSLYLFTYILADTFFRALLQDSASLMPSPTMTRWTVPTICTIVLVLFFTSLFMASSNFAAISGPESDLWDRYSPRIGLESRRAFATVVGKYSVPYFFPAPFNLLPVLLVQLPQAVLRLLKKNQWRTLLQGLEKGLWILVVLPLSTITAGLWFWGWL